MVETGDGGYAVTGYTTVRLNKRKSKNVVWLLKTDQNGDTMWTQVYDKFILTGGRSVYETPDKGYIILAECTKYNGFALLKTDSLGNLIWTRRYRKGACWALSMAMTLDGGFIISGSANEFDSEDGLRIGTTWLLGDIWLMGDVRLVKLDSLGRYKGRYHWGRTYSSERGGSSGNSVILSNDGGYIVAGDVFGYLSRKGGDFCELLIFRVDSKGRIVWRKTYPEHDRETRYLWNKTDSVWVYFFNAGINSGECIQPSFDGGYIIITLGGGLVKTDSIGNIQWRRNEWIDFTENAWVSGRCV